MAHGPFRDPVSKLESCWDAATTALKRGGPKRPWSPKGGQTLFNAKQLTYHFPKWWKFFCMGRWAPFSKLTVSERPYQEQWGKQWGIPRSCDQRKRWLKSKARESVRLLGLAAMSSQVHTPAIPRQDELLRACPSQAGHVLWGEPLYRVHSRTP